MLKLTNCFGPLFNMRGRMMMYLDVPGQWQIRRIYSSSNTGKKCPNTGRFEYEQSQDQTEKDKHQEPQTK